MTDAISINSTVQSTASSPRVTSIYRTCLIQWNSHQHTYTQWDTHKKTSTTSVLIFSLTQRRTTTTLQKGACLNSGRDNVPRNPVQWTNCSSDTLADWRQTQTDRQRETREVWHTHKHTHKNTPSTTNVLILSLTLCKAYWHAPVMLRAT